MRRSYFCALCLNASSVNNHEASFQKQNKTTQNTLVSQGLSNRSTDNSCSVEDYSKKKWLRQYATSMTYPDPLKVKS